MNRCADGIGGTFIRQCRGTPLRQQMSSMYRSSGGAGTRARYSIESVSGFSLPGMRVVIGAINHARYDRDHNGPVCRTVEDGGHGAR